MERVVIRRRSLVSGMAALVWLLAAGAPVQAAGVTFGSPTATSTFGKGIEFVQPVSLPASGIRRVELLVDFPRAAGPEVRVIQPSAGATSLRYLLDTSNGGLLPNTTMTARWRVVAQDGTADIGPSVSVRYDDTRFTWQTREGPLVRVHWYQGTSAFGDHALQIGTDAIAKTSQLLGVTETAPVDFFVYATQQAFYDALGPGTRENVGGEAIPEIRTLFALITPTDINAAWVGIVIPHELTHLVFDTAVSNPYHFPPRWLNEGLAVYLAQGYGTSDHALVDRAVADGSLMPLAALVSQFPTTSDRFALAYAESVAAVDYFVRQSGEAALVSLIRSYSTGVTDDEAFSAAIGKDVAGFDAAWRASINAPMPAAYGPRPAPNGPLPADWTAAVPVANGSPLPQSPGAAASPSSSASASGAGTGTSGRGIPVLLLVAVIVAILGVALVAVAVRRPSPSGLDNPRPR